MFNKIFQWDSATVIKGNSGTITKNVEVVSRPTFDDMKTIEHE